MLAKINAPIPKQSFERIRDRVGKILFVELANQAILHNNPELGATVYVERTRPVDRTEAPLISVAMFRMQASERTHQHTKQSITYYIDVYTKGAYSSVRPGYQNGGDSLGIIRGAEICGKVRAILESNQYKRLGFDTAKNVVNNHRLDSITPTEPEDVKDAESLVLHRIEYVVDSVDESVFESFGYVSDLDVEVQINETQKGFKVSSSQALISGSSVFEIASTGVILVSKSNVRTFSAVSQVELVSTGIITNAETLFFSGDSEIQIISTGVVAVS